MPNSINTSLELNAQQSVDGKRYKLDGFRHRPYLDKQEVLDTIPPTQRHEGQDFRVFEGGGIAVYVFTGGIEDIRLVRDNSAGGISHILQEYTGASNFTINNDTTEVSINPNNTLVPLMVTMPSSPKAGQPVSFVFGGKITSGEVVQELTIKANSGQALRFFPNTPVSATVDTVFKFRYFDGVWYNVKGRELASVDWGNVGGNIQDQHDLMNIINNPDALLSGGNVSIITDIGGSGSGDGYEDISVSIPQTKYRLGNVVYDIPAQTKLLDERPQQGNFRIDVVYLDINGLQIETGIEDPSPAKPSIPYKAIEISTVLVGFDNDISSAPPTNIPDLSSVLTAGNKAQKDIEFEEGKGIVLEDSGRKIRLTPDALTDDRNLKLPNKSGILATLDDVSNGGGGGTAEKEEIDTSGDAAKTIADDTTLYVINPSAPVATMTRQLPVSPAEGQKISINILQNITSFTITCDNAHTVIGDAITAEKAEPGDTLQYQFFNLKYYRT